VKLCAIGQPRAVTWRTSEQVVSCDIIGIDHHITIDRPRRFDQLSDPVTIVCLDGAWTAGTVRDATRIMSMGGEAPEAVVVGVSFTDASMTDYLTSRARWFSPTAWVPPVETGIKNAVAAEMGQAAAYLDFLTKTLVPMLQSEHDVATGERWLVGHSFSGLFGLRTLFTQPDAYDAYLLASPSIWWDDRAILEIESKWAEVNDNLAARLFLSAGLDELASREDGDEFRMRANVEDLAAQLVDRAYPGLAIEHKIFADESHNSTIGAAVSAGLRSLHV